jgi:hypothetical protein
MKHVKCKLCGEEHPLGGCPKFKQSNRGHLAQLMQQKPVPKAKMRPGSGGRRGA